MQAKWTKHDVVVLLDFHVWNLRILARREGDPDTPEKDLCLPTEWSIGNRGGLYEFDLAGIKASGYPEILNEPASAVYATPHTFLQFVEGALSDSQEGARLTREWRRLPSEIILLDPRYVAFRTAHDWISLHANALAEDGAASRQVLDPSSHPDPFQAVLPIDAPPELATLTAAHPLHLADGGFRNRWDPNYAEPWPSVRDRIGALHYFHFRATVLLQKLCGQLDYNPNGLAFLVAMQIVQDAAEMPIWRGQERPDVERDPRFIAHRCAFNRGMVSGTTGAANAWHRSQSAALEEVERVRFEEFAAFLGQPTECHAKPN
jgi:hypothetical protein